MNLEVWKMLTEGAEFDGCGSTTVGVPHGNGYAIELETALFLYGLVRREQPTFVIETGTHLGFSAAVIGLALKDNSLSHPRKMEGALFSVDSGAYEGKPEALWKRCELGNIVHKVADSEISATYEKVPDGVVDLVWYDADHSAEAIVREYDSTFRCLNKKRCIIGWHDTKLDERMPGGIYLILEDLKKRRLNGTGWKHISHWGLRNMRGADFVMLSSEDY